MNFADKVKFARETDYLPEKGKQLSRFAFYHEAYK
jgi:hypothetical protein